LNYTRSALLWLLWQRNTPTQAQPFLMIEGLPERAIKTFARREGRMTQAQARALEDFGHSVLIDNPLAARFDPLAAFSANAPLHLDIGFGAGESIANSAYLNPDQNYLGLEVHRPGVGQLLLKLDAQKSRNVRVAVVDAVEFLHRSIGSKSLSSVRIFCPDPWPKQRHCKRRLIQDEFIQIVRGALILHGELFLATDWAPYADHMLKVLSRAPGFINRSPTQRFAPRFAERPLTRFENRGLGLGHAVFDLHFARSE